MNRTLEKEISDYFNHFETVALVYLYGSHAAGTAGDDSDVDIAYLLTPAGLKNKTILQERFLSDISYKLRKDIHLLLLNTAGETILEQIFKKGKCILKRDSRVAKTFLATESQ